MAEAAARSALDGLYRPGRHGKAEAAAGVTLAELGNIALASVIARKGRAAQASEAARRSFGIDLPETPRRVQAKGIELLWAGPGQWLALSRESLPAGELEDAALGGLRRPRLGRRAERRAHGPAHRRPEGAQRLGQGLAHRSPPAGLPPGRHGAHGRGPHRRADLADQRGSHLRTRRLPRLRPQLLEVPRGIRGGIRLRDRLGPLSRDAARESGQ